MRIQPSRLCRIQGPWQILLAVCFFCVPALGSATGQSEILIAPHRAAYTLELKRTGSSGTIADARGAMIYTWGETCDGWTVEQQFMLNVVRGDGNGIHLKANSSTWESKDGRRFRFNIKRESNGAEVEKIRGEGRLQESGGAGEAVFDLPESKRIPLPKGTVFPTAHTLRLMERAIGGARTDRQIVFDGSEIEAPGPVSAFILPPKDANDADAVITPPLGPHPVRVFQLAFFAPESSATEPEFEMSIALQDNGVAPSLTLDYGDYAVQGKLVRIEALDKPDC